MNKKQVLKIIDSCFHAYASDYRIDAKKMATELIDNIEALSLGSVVDICDHDFVGQEIYNEMSEPIGRQCAKCGTWDDEWTD